MSIERIDNNRYQVNVFDETLIATTSEDGKVVKIIGG